MIRLLGIFAFALTTCPSFGQKLPLPFEEFPPEGLPENHFLLLVSENVDGLIVTDDPYTLPLKDFQVVAMASYYFFVRVLTSWDFYENVQAIGMQGLPLADSMREIAQLHAPGDWYGLEPIQIDQVLVDLFREKIMEKVTWFEKKFAPLPGHHYVFRAIRTDGRRSSGYDISQQEFITSPGR